MAFGLHAPLAFAAVNSSKKAWKTNDRSKVRKWMQSYPKLFSFLSMVNWSCGLGNLLGHLLLQASVKEKINLELRRTSFVQSFAGERRGGGPMTPQTQNSTPALKPKLKADPAHTRNNNATFTGRNFGVALELMRGHFWAWTLVTNRMQSLPKTNFNLCNNVPVYLYQNWQDLNSSDVFRAKITQLIRGLCHECHLLF